MSESYTLNPCCKDSTENASPPRPVAATSSPATEQITSNPLGTRAAGFALAAVGAGVVATAIVLNVRQMFAAEGASPLDALPIGLATAAFALAPAAAGWAWRVGHRLAAAFALTLALGSGAVSITNLAGTALAPRLQSAAEAGDRAARRADARATIERDVAELAALGVAGPPAPGRSSAAIGAELQAVLASRRDLEGCEAHWLSNAAARSACIRAAGLRAEHAEAVAAETRAQRWAERRSAVEARIAAARATVDEAGSRAAASPDDAAVVMLAARLGWKWDVETVGLIKSLLTAVLFEGSAALAFMLAGVVMVQPRHPRTASETRGTPPGPSATRATAPVVPGVPLPEARGTPQIRPLAAETGAAGVPTGPERDADSDATPVSSRETVLQVLRGRGGSVIGPQRSLAELFGLPKSTLHRQLRELEEAGAVRLLVSARGTAVSLLEPAAA